MTFWKNPALLRLWLADALSKTGTEVTRVALPLTAILVLNATPAQMGLLGVARSLPNLLFGLFVGVWVDRVKRGPILVAADIGRALLLGSIPLAAWLGWLTFTQIVIVVFATATLTIFFTLGAISILPSLVGGEALIDANSKFELTGSALGIVGPGIAGALVQLITAPIAIAIDAISYLLSAVTLRGVDTFEQVTVTAQQRTLWHEIGEGIGELLRTPILRGLTVAAGLGTLGGAMQGTVYLLFMTETLTLDPAWIGFVFAVGGVGSIVGAVVAGRVSRYLGVGGSIIGGNLLWAIGTLIAPLASKENALLILCGGQMLSALGATIWSIHQMSLRQRITPVNLFARATAARRFLIFGMGAGGAALGGWLGGSMGLRMTLLIGAVVFSFGFLAILLSPIRTMQTVTDAMEP